MKNFISKGIIPLVFSFLFLACSTNNYTPKANEVLISVAPEKYDCQGVTEMKCLKIKEANDKEWSFFYSEIEGFDYRPGYEYELVVRKEKSKEEFADASSERYILVKILKKTRK